MIDSRTALFGGGSDMARRMSVHDWDGSAFGPVASWPASLQAATALLLDSRFPMFLAWGQELRFLYNDAYAAILGSKHPAALGRPFATIWQEIWADVSPLVDRALAGEASWVEDLPLVMNRHGADERTWFTFSYSPVRDQTGQVAGIFCACHETTRQVRAEAASRALNETLEARVEERTERLLAAEERLLEARKLEAIGQLTGGVAHDFNNLLTVIRGSVDLLRRPTLAEEKRVRYLDAISATAGQATILTAQLLAFARRQALTPKRFDACEALQHVAGVIRETLDPGIQLDIDIKPHACFMFADRAQFETAIINIAANARDAMNGEGRLTITADPAPGIPAVRAHAAVPGDFIAVTISDTGTGIAADQLTRIFEPFVTTKAVGAGSGLGLSQAIGFAKQSGGDIAVESREGHGATFTLYMPSARATKPAAGAPRPRSPGCVDARVLVVEDNPHVGLFATQALEDLGYESALAPDASSALIELAREPGRYRLVLSDVVMPGMNGVDFGREVGRLYPTITVILASGYSEILANDGEHGFHFLQKPFSIDQLSSVLKTVLGHPQH